ncbi:MAG: glutamate 5-kinase [Pseudomonadota bacterium]|nr:glutamate 5-kinase [Pseudomonadota bacterium]
MSRSVIADAHRLVVKVGSSLVTNEGRGLDHERLALWSAQIAKLTALGKEIVLVSSGAIAEGISRLGWSKRPVALNELQAAAAVGQMGLIEAYERSFRVHGLQTAQILLTHADLADRERYLNARSTLRTLLELKVIPIINENDTVTTEEIKVGDNDTLSALVANLIEADVLVILTDQRGLYSADPRKHPDAEFIHEAVAGTANLEAMAGGAGSSVGTGGMLTKILAAKRAARSGAHTVIVSGREDDVLARLGAGEAIGTQLLARNAPLAARRQWLADHLQVRGRLKLDDGAVRALREQGKSLLSIGVAEVVGEFHRGEVVACSDGDGRDIARGLVNYGSDEARRIARHPSGQIASLLGYMDEVELIHRDNLVLL